MRVVLTQTQPRVAALATRISLAGHEPALLSFANIRMRLDEPAVARALAGLDAVDWVIPVSPSAVDALVQARSSCAGALRARVGLIGPGSLEHWPAGLAADEPLLPGGNRFDGEALVASLLKAPRGERLAGQRIVLLQSAARRPAWSDALVARGATVEVIACYAVDPLTPANDEVVTVLSWLGELRSSAAAAPLFVASSAAIAADCLHWLHRSWPDEHPLVLNHCPWLVQHARIAASLRAAGVAHVRLIAPGEMALVEALESGS